MTKVIISTLHSTWNVLYCLQLLNKQEGNKMSREYTNSFLELIEDGLVDKDDAIIMCMKYMSEDDVKGMMEANCVDELLEDEVHWD